MKLPVNKTGNLRIYEAAGAFVLNNGGSFSQDDLIDYVRELNQSRELQLEEGFLLPFCLKLCLLEHITQSALSMLKAAENYERMARLVKEGRHEAISKELSQNQTGESFYNLMGYVLSGTVKRIGSIMPKRFKQARPG